MAPQRQVLGGRCGLPHPGPGPAGGAAGAARGGARWCAAGAERWPQGFWSGTAAPLRSWEAPRTAPGQRPQPPAARAAAARAPLRTSRAVLPASTPRGCQAARGVRPPAGPRPGRGTRGLDHPHRVSRAPPPRPPPGWSGARAPRQHPGPGRSRLAGAGGVVPGLAPWRGAPGAAAAAMADTGSHQRRWRSAMVAAVHPGDGHRRDGSRGVAQGGAVLPGPTMAPGADSLKAEAG
jgi:hypothetical protein